MRTIGRGLNTSLSPQASRIKMSPFLLPQLFRRIQDEGDGAYYLMVMLY